MSTLLDDVKTRILAIATAAGYAVDKGDMRDDTDKRVGLHEYAGTTPDRQFGALGVYEEHPNFQVTVRGEPTDYTGPRAVIQSIYEDLAKVMATTLASGLEYRRVTPAQSPFPIQRDDKGRWLFAVNFRVDRRAA